MATEYRTRPISTADYHAMGDAGILRPDERVELLDGQLVSMPPIGDDHAYVVRRLIAILQARFAGRAIIDIQNPLGLDTYSEPQPDAMLLASRADWYRGTQPEPRDVLLVVEVSDSTLRYDRGRKLRAYARVAIREVWIVNLVDARLERYWDPVGEVYAKHHVAAREDLVAPAAFPDHSIAVADLLP